MSHCLPTNNESESLHTFRTMRCHLLALPRSHHYCKLRHMSTFDTRYRRMIPLVLKEAKDMEPGLEELDHSLLVTNGLHYWQPHVEREATGEEDCPWIPCQYGVIEEAEGHLHMLDHQKGCSRNAVAGRKRHRTCRALLPVKVVPE